MHLHDEGALHLRQFDQQQGPVLRLRTCRGDREEPDLHAHEGGTGREEGGGSAPRPEAGKQREDADHRKE